MKENAPSVEKNQLSSTILEITSFVHSVPKELKNQKKELVGIVDRLEESITMEMRNIFVLNVGNYFFLT